MTHSSIKPPYYEKLNEINKKYASQSRDNSKYTQEIAALFNVKRRPITEHVKYWFAGIIEGEGSLNVSVKKHPTAKFGLTLDPEFSVTQSSLAPELLVTALDLFQTGRISWKQGSESTLVYKISTRQTLMEKVCSFYEAYCFPLGSEYKNKRYTLFKKMISLMLDGKHLDVNSLCNDLLPLWSDLRVQTSSKTVFKTLDQAQAYVRAQAANKRE